MLEPILLMIAFKEIAQALCYLIKFTFYHGDKSSWEYTDVFVL